MDIKPKNTFKTLPYYSSNPFNDALLNFVHPRVKNVKEFKDAVVSDTSEVVSFPVHTGDKIYYWSDKITFIKVFNDQDNFKDMAGLSKAANCLFWLISSKLKPNAEIIRLQLVEYMEYADTTNRGQFYNSVVELADKFFIAKIGADTFYINYTKFFNGRREVFAGDPFEAYIKRNSQVNTTK